MTWHSARALAITIALACVTLGVVAPARADGGGELLAGKSPSASRGVRHPGLLTDGVAPEEGDYWKSTLMALFDPGGSVTWDLGEKHPIRAAWLQGDNNDRYELAVSDDGASFRKVWDVPSASGGGVRERSARDLDAEGRYVRLRQLSGDGSYSLSEVRVYGEVPSTFTEHLARKKGVPLDDRMRSATLVFGLALIGLVLATRRGIGWLWLALAAAPALAAGAYAVDALLWAWPVTLREVSLVRGVAATVAAVALLREAFAPARFRAHRAVLLSVLLSSGVLGVLGFYNLGRPQFYDAAHQSWTPVHFLDLRQYYSTAKYFDEIGYRHLYDADMAAYMQDGDLSFDSVASLPMRDLDDHQVKSVGQQRTEVELVKGRFSPERWDEYRRDQRYFRGAMGTSQYLDMMHDMGGNATPVWITTAHYLFNWLPANNQSFLWTGLLDPLLIGLAFLCIWRSFGPRTACACMVVFGANDFIMYGSNWGGATLRHDWMAYIALGACAIKSKHFALGGVLLALATGIRAFPALSLIFLGAAPAWWVLEQVRSQRKLPRVSELRAQFKGTERIWIAAAIALAVLFAISTRTTSLSAWRDWYAKVSLLSAEPHANHISWRSFVGGWGDDQMRVVRERAPIYWAGILGFTAAVLFLARRRPPEQGALLGLMLMPVYFYPANYYIHFIYVLPMLAIERKHDDPGFSATDAKLVIALCLLCAAQYFTVPITDKGLHFYSASVLLFVTLASILALLVREDLRGWWDALPEAVPAPIDVAAAAATEPDLASPVPAPIEAVAATAAPQE